MNINIEQRRPFSVEERIKELHIKRREILSLTPEEALNQILDYRQADALVHSFPEEDFYFLIHDIGIEDSLELLYLASNRQWEYILDVEVWEQDRITLPLLTKWLYMLMKADPNRVIQWFLNEKTEFIELYLFKNIEVLIREHDQDPSDFPGDFFTFDDTFYVRFADGFFEPETMEQRDEFLSEFLNRIADYDHFTYQSVLLESAGVIPAEAEEEAYRLRNVRLAEKGFMPFDEAVGVYQPLKPKAVKTQVKKLIPRSGARNLLPPVPIYPTEMLDEDNLFTLSLKTIEMDEVLLQTESEFAGLCNQVIAADQKPIREREQLKYIVRKVCGYINIGLEKIAEDENTGHTINHSAALIQKFPLSKIFRVGYGLALDLKWRAQKWQKASWFTKAGLPITFWGEEWTGVLGGLLIRKPLYFDNYKTGLLFREFASVEDIQATENILNQIMAFDRLLSMLSLNRFPKTDILNYKNLILTLWARYYLGLSEDCLSLGLAEFREFFTALWTEKEHQRVIKRSMKVSFLNWLSGKTGTEHDEIIQKSGETLRNLFEEIESEYREVLPAYLDPRHIYLFLLSGS